MKMGKDELKSAEEEYKEDAQDKAQKKPKKKPAMCKFDSEAGLYSEKLMFDEGCDLEAEYKELIELWNQENPENKHRTFVSAEWI